jgi:hypothetical protein
VAVTTDSTLCPARSATTREGYLTNLTEIACTLQPVNPRSTNRLNLRNELDSLGIEDFLERTDHHLPYPQRRTRLSALVVAVTTGEVDTCSISTGDGWTEGRNRFRLRSVTGSKILAKLEKLGCV